MNLDHRDHDVESMENGRPNQQRISSRSKALAFLFTLKKNCQESKIIPVLTNFVHKKKILDVMVLWYRLTQVKE